MKWLRHHITEPICSNIFPLHCVATVATPQQRAYLLQYISSSLCRNRCDTTAESLPSQNIQYIALFTVSQWLRHHIAAPICSNIFPLHCVATIATAQSAG